MRRTWQALARPFEAIIVWLACHIFGHPVRLVGTRTARCVRCGQRYDVLVQLYDR